MLELLPMPVLWVLGVLLALTIVAGFVKQVVAPLVRGLREIVETSRQIAALIEHEAKPNGGRIAGMARDLDTEPTVKDILLDLRAILAAHDQKNDAHHAEAMGRLDLPPFKWFKIR
jgi:hypothetical protein